MFGLEILTPTGFQPFTGVKLWRHERSLRVTFTDGRAVRCALQHRFIVDGREKFAENLALGDNCGSSQVSAIELLEGPVDLYDPTNVENGELYLHDGGKISHNTFLGSSNTLIAGEHLVKLAPVNPLEKHGDVLIYERPKPDHEYVLVADTCKARGMDYSAFTILDVTERPYAQVAVYRNNRVSPQIYPDVIYKYAKAYNNAYTIIESNDQGATVFRILRHQFAYERMFVGRVKSGATEGFEMHAKNKRQGCSNLKDLIERGNLLLRDKTTIHELKTFEAKGTGWEAAPGSHDDTVTPLIMFAWFTESNAFQEITDTNLRQLMAEDAERLVRESVPFVGLPSTDSFVPGWAPSLEGHNMPQERFYLDDVFGVAVERVEIGRPSRPFDF